MNPTLSLFSLAALALRVAGHAAPFAPCFFGYNATAEEYGYDNRMVAPLMNYPFNQWWMHNHMDKPPHPDDVCELNSGGTASFEIACDKGYTSYYASSPGGDIRVKDSNFCCPNQAPISIHAANEGMTAGCAIGIAYKSDVHDVQPEDFVIISVKHDCPWYLHNDFQIPAGLPECPNGKCICSWFWVPDLGGGMAQMYMNPFQCRTTGQTGTTPLGKPGVARQCGPNTRTGVTQYDANNCTVGPKNPLYAFQTERNNVNSDIYNRPVYHDYYGFPDGAQQDLFIDAFVGALGSAPANTPAPTPAPASSSSSTAAPATTPAPETTQASLAPASPSPETIQASPAPASPVPASPSPESTQGSPAPAPPAPASPAPAEPSPAATSPSTTPQSLVATPIAASSSPVATTPTVASPLPVEVSPSVTTLDPSPTRACKPRNGKKKRSTKKRSAVQRHLKKRLAHENTL